jgi:conjugal transfer/entry exclusion protein
MSPRQSLRCRIAAAVLLATSAGTPHAQGIPVIDIANLIQTISR